MTDRADEKGIEMTSKLIVLGVIAAALATSGAAASTEAPLADGMA